MLKQPQLRQRLAEGAYDVVANTSDQFAQFIRSEFQMYEKVVKAAGIKPE